MDKKSDFSLADLLLSVNGQQPPLTPKDSTSQLGSILVPRSTVNARKVPHVGSLPYGTQAKNIDASVIYIDLAGSTMLSERYGLDVAVSVIGTFLRLASDQVRRYGGEIRSFDGDRVMAVFHKAERQSRAVKSALTFASLVPSLQAKLRATYHELARDTYEVRFGIGIDDGAVRAFKVGLPHTNDLAWAGRPPNLAAKLSGIRNQPDHTFITNEVFRTLPLALTHRLGQPLWRQAELTFYGRRLLVFATANIIGISKLPVGLVPPKSPMGPL